MVREGLMCNLIFGNSQEDDHSPAHCLGITAEVGLQGLPDRSWSNASRQCRWNGADDLGSLKLAAPGLEQKISFAPLNALDSAPDSQFTTHASIVCHELLPKAAHAAGGACQARAPDGNAKRCIDEWSLIYAAVHGIFD